MAKQRLENLMHVFGRIVWGDIGPLTMYRNRKGKMVAFTKTWPDKPPSDRQLDQRQRFIDAAAAWAALSDTQRQQWELATERASLCMHGYDLWIHWQTINDQAAIETLQRQTKTTLLA